MYPVHIMRTFVCDRLTAAAQEILGAFEKRVEDYEAEIARQRRLLDKVFSHETKLQQTELPLSEEQSHLNQTSNNESGSKFMPNITKIKDEYEEMCISEERLQNQQQQTTTCDPDVSVNHPQPLDPDQQSSANTASPSHISNKDGEPESDTAISAASAAHGDQTLRHESSCEAEIQQADSNDSLPMHVEASLNEKSAVKPAETSAENTLFPECSDELLDQINDNESTALQVVAECFSDENCDDSKSTPASVTEPSQLEESNAENTNWATSNEVTQIESAASGTDNEQQREVITHQSKATQSEGNEKIKYEKSALPSVEPTQYEESQDGRPVLTLNTTPNETSQDGKHGLTESLDATQVETSDKDTTLITSDEPASVIKCQNPTFTERPETPQEGSDKTPSTASKDLISSEVAATSFKKTELGPKKKPKVEKRSKRISDLTGKTKPRDEKASRSRLRSHKKRSDDGTRFIADSASMSGDDPHDATLEPSDGSSDENRVEEKAKTLSGSKQTQGKKHSPTNAASPGNNESAQREIVKEETSESTKTPVRRLSDRKKASTYKGKHKAKDQSQTSSQSKALSLKEKAGAASRSKEGTSGKRQNEGQSSDSAQNKRPKSESPTSTKGNEENTPETYSKDSTESPKDPEPSPNQSDDASGNSAEERENPFKCDRCGKVMSNFKNYKFHMKSHTVAKTFKCDTCGKMFRESWDLNKHLVIHSVEKPFKCDICGNGFNRRYNLDLHVRVHTGEKPYECDTCGKSFSSCVNMKKHTRIHTGEKPYTCKDCGKEFADSSAFKNHLRVHTGEKPFKCTYCKRKFATRTTLKRHTRTHTGEKPYKCTVCDKNFGHKTDLKGHMRMHTGEKPYKCAVCTDQFSTWSKLNKHKRIHANEPQGSTHKSVSDMEEQNQT